VHCRLTAGAAELEVLDLESTNGTFVNGERVERALLKGGDRLGVGRVELTVEKSTC
jgi:pSer/pThr/pTyr-binding forkhead associated (FHA) protein